MAKKIKTIKKTPAQVKKDLALFERGVERLKELEKELNDLDTRGFARDEKKIRSKLKNVSDIPTIEEEIKALRLKINNKFKPKRKRKSKVVEQLKDLNEKLESIEKASKKKPKKKTFVDSGVGVLVNTDFNNFLTDVKSRLSERVRGKEEELDEILRSDLQKRELDFKKRHDDLVREFNSKKRKLTDKFEKEYADKIKKSLQKEVSEKFNSKLKSKLDSEKVALGKKYKAVLKLHADEKLRKEELELKTEHNKKIEALENAFAKKNEKLENDLIRKYDLKLKGLGEQEKGLRERARVFELERQRKLAFARDKIDSEEKKMVARNNAKMRALEAKETALEERVKKAKLKEKEMLDANKIRIRDADLREKKRLENADLREKKRLEEDRVKLSLEREKMVADIENERKAMDAKVKREEKAILAKVGLREKMLNKRIAKNVELSENYKKKIDENKSALMKHEKKLEEDKRHEVEKIKRELAGKFHVDLNAELVRKEEIMRAQLKNEYDLLLKRKIEEHENELKRKKLDLELEIQRKMKAALA